MLDRTLSIPTYQVGGSLPSSSPSYVKRKADDELLTALQQGEFCYVFNARQMGKSSLRVQATERLQKLGVRCGVIDITSIGTQSVTAEQWYASIIGTLTKSFQLDLPLVSWWKEHSHLSLINRFSEFIETVLLVQVSEPVVIFIDEIDSVLGLNFSTDDFFAIIRACYNQRAENLNYQRLTFALFGVATPSSLIADVTRTPFNIGKGIQLSGFKSDESQPLLAGFPDTISHPEAILQRILYWTEGQPFLTQKLCKLVADRVRSKRFSVTVCSKRFSVSDPNSQNHWLDNLIHSRIIDNWEAQDEPEHLRTIRDRLLFDEQKVGRLLGLYQKILISGGITADNSPEQVELILMGLVTQQGGIIRVKNPIYKQVFNSEWTNEQLAHLRPYSQAIKGWIASGSEDESWLLQGQALRDVLAWSQGKKLGDVDYQFLAASQERDRAMTEQLLETERLRTVETRLELEQKNLKRQRIFIGILSVMMIVSMILGGMAYQESQQRAIGELRSIVLSSEALVNSEQWLDALMQAVKGKERLQRLGQVDPGLETKVNGLLEQIVLNVPEKNRLVGHQTMILAVDYRSDGQQMVTIDLNGTINLWHRDGSLQKTIVAAHQGGLEKILYSPDGEILVSGGDQTLKVWHPDGEELYCIPTNSSPLMGMAFSPDGSRLILGRANGLMELWSRGSKTVQQFLTQDTGILGIAWSPDGETIGTANVDGMVKLWDLDGQLQQTLIGHDAAVQTIAFSPDGSAIASADSEGEIRLWKSNGTPLFTINAHEGLVRELRFSPDGQWLASSSYDKTLKLWSRNGVLRHTFRVHTGIVMAIAFSPDGSEIVSASEDHRAIIWKTNNRFHSTISGLSKASTALTFNPDGSRIVNTGNNENTQIWQLDGTLVKRVPIDLQLIGSIVSSPDDGEILAFPSGEQTVSLSDWNGNLIQTIAGYPSNVFSLAWHPDGKLFSGTDNGEIWIWQPNNTLPQSFSANENPAPIWALKFSPDGQILVSGADNTLQLWNAQGQLQKVLNDHQATVWNIAFHPNGQPWASASGDSTVKLWQRDGTLLKTLTGHQDAVWGLAFSPQPFSSHGHILATSSIDKTVKLWTEEGILLNTLKAHHGAVRTLAFHPHLPLLASAADDQTLILWNIEEILKLDPLPFACDWLHDYLRTNTALQPDEAQLCRGEG